MKPRLQLELRKGDREVLEARRNSRTQPCLPLGIGHIRTQTHDYVRNGTTTLFATLDYATGKVLHRTATAHTHQEWLAFLRQIDRTRDQLGQPLLDLEQPAKDNEGILSGDHYTGR